MLNEVFSYSFTVSISILKTKTLKHRCMYSSYSCIWVDSVVTCCVSSVSDVALNRCFTVVFVIAISLMIYVGYGDWSGGGVGGW